MELPVGKTQRIQDWVHIKQILAYRRGFLSAVNRSYPLHWVVRHSTIRPFGLGYGSTHLSFSFPNLARGFLWKKDMALGVKFEKRLIPVLRVQNN